MDAYPTFKLAVETFQEFLRNEGHTDVIQWIWREDIFTRRTPGTHRLWTRPIYVSTCKTCRESLVERYYQCGVDRGLGLAMCVFCIADGWACSYIYLPEDKTDAEHRMMADGLKCQIPTPPPDALVITHPLVRHVIRFLVGTPSNSWINDVPTRSGAERLVKDMGK